MIVCKKCNLEKNESEYYKNHSECKQCWREYCKIKRKEKIDKDPLFLEKQREYLRKWRKNNQEKDKEYTKKSLIKNKEKIAERKKTPEYRKMINVCVKNWRKNNIERFRETEKLRRMRDRKKELARNLIKKHIQRGKMVKLNQCEMCGSSEKIEAHHIDYDQPLNVQWLCYICHKHEHNKLMDIGW